MFTRQVEKGAKQLGLPDVEATEAAEKQLDQFLRRREKDLADEGGDRAFQNELERREQERREKRREENRLGWIDVLGHRHSFYLQAAARAADQRARLIAEGGYEPEDGPEAA